MQIPKALSRGLAVLPWLVFAVLGIAAVLYGWFLVHNFG